MPDTVIEICPHRSRTRLGCTGHKEARCEWKEKGRDSYTLTSVRCEAHLHLSFPLIPSHPPALLTFSFPEARSWNGQVSLIYPRKLGLIWNQGAPASAFQVLRLQVSDTRDHLASPSLLVTTLSRSGLCLASQQGSHLVPTGFLHQLYTSGHKPRGIFSGCLWCVRLLTHSFNKYFSFLKF